MLFEQAPKETNEYKYKKSALKQTDSIIQIVFLPFYQNASGVPWTATYIQAKGDPIADLYEDIAAEEKARATYQWLIDLTDDVDLQDGLKFLREREVIHSQRFREAVEILKEDRELQKVF